MHADRRIAVTFRFGGSSQKVVLILTRKLSTRHKNPTNFPLRGPRKQLALISPRPRRAPISNPRRLREGAWQGRVAAASSPAVASDGARSWLGILAALCAVASCQ